MGLRLVVKNAPDNVSYLGFRIPAKLNDFSFKKKVHFHVYRFVLIFFGGVER